MRKFIIVFVALILLTLSFVFFPLGDSASSYAANTDAPIYNNLLSSQSYYWYNTLTGSVEYNTDYGFAVKSDFDTSLVSYNVQILNSQYPSNRMYGLNAPITIDNTLAYTLSWENNILSSFPIYILVKVGKWRSQRLETGHMDCSMRVYEGEILLVDEIGHFFPSSMKDVPDSVKSFFRLFRHYTDGYIILTEQDYNNIHISIRRVITHNIVLQPSEHKSKPFLFVLLNRLFLFLRLPYYLSPYGYGFRFSSYEIAGNTETSSSVVVHMDTESFRDKVSEYIVAPSASCYYDDRCYFSYYDALFSVRDVDPELGGTVND
ncbi:MAG: zonular occludens toxin domain-containing protein [Clostridiales bacterium]|jgi:hypothetical protein|nr:zonular occludens toxin domain-containing protein [Clostridiales bacterium]